MAGRAVSQRSGPEANGIGKTRTDSHEPRGADRRGAIWIRLRSLAWQGFSGSSWLTDFSYAAGRVLFWHTRGRHAVCSSRAADAVVSREALLWHAGVPDS